MKSPMSFCYLLVVLQIAEKCVMDVKHKDTTGT